MSVVASPASPEVYLIVVDDDHDDCALILMHYMQTNWHQHVKALTDSDSLFSLLDATPAQNQLPTVIVLDCNMPRLDGEALLMMLKNNERYKNIVVVMYSTSMTEHLNKRLLHLGAHACRRKPTTIREMQQLLNELQQFTLSFRSDCDSISSESQALD